MGLPKPWTDDPVFQKTYFCNVRREDDKTTQWIRKSWSYPASPNFPLAMCMARIFNLPSTLTSIGFPHEWDAQYLRDVLYKKTTTSSRIWSGAYVITTHGRKISKAAYCVEILDHIAQADLGTSLRRVDTLQEAYDEIRSFEGFASFLSAQVVADLKNTPGYHLREADDWWTFCAPGPGSLRGLGWYFNLGRSATQAEFHPMITMVEQDLKRRGDIPQLCRQDLQNCLCEFDKYRRVKTGAGRSKRNYPGV